MLAVPSPLHSSEQLQIRIWHHLRKWAQSQSDYLSAWPILFDAVPNLLIYYVVMLFVQFLLAHFLYLSDHSESFFVCVKSSFFWAFAYDIQIFFTFLKKQFIEMYFFCVSFLQIMIFVVCMLCPSLFIYLLFHSLVVTVCVCSYQDASFHLAHPCRSVLYII